MVISSSLKGVGEWWSNHHSIIRLVKILSISFFMCFILNGCAQTTTSPGYIKGKQYEGHVFPKEYVSFFAQFEGQTGRFTPTEKEIEKAEQIIKSQLININRPIINQGGECPIIHLNLPKYKRQYIGYVDINGDRILWMNFIGGNDKVYLSDLNNDIIMMHDGCSYFWNIKVNLSRAVLFDLNINGIG